MMLRPITLATGPKTKSTICFFFYNENVNQALIQEVHVIVLPYNMFVSNIPAKQNTFCIHIFCLKFEQKSAKN